MSYLNVVQILPQKYICVRICRHCNQNDTLNVYRSVFSIYWTYSSLPLSTHKCPSSQMRIQFVALPLYYVPDSKWDCTNGVYTTWMTCCVVCPHSVRFLYRLVFAHTLCLKDPPPQWQWQQHQKQAHIIKPGWRCTHRAFTRIIQSRRRGGPVLKGNRA